MNRCLSVSSLKEFELEINFFNKICPDLIHKKNQLALSQYALLLKFIIEKRLNIFKAKILVIGSYEDLLALALKRLGAYVEEVDPNLNFLLEDFIQKPAEDGVKYDLIFSISVLEHVENDINFLKICESKLKKGGFQYHTFDYLPHYKNLPPTHYRFYSDTYVEKIRKLLLFSRMYGEQDYKNYLLDFNYNNLTYCFASILFERL